MKKTNHTKQKTATRRDFLKKAAYHAPSLIVMGQLAKPDIANAGGINSTPSGPPGGRPRRP